VNLKSSMVSLCYLVCCCFNAEAGQVEEQAAVNITAWVIQTSIYTRHFDPEPDHNNDQNMLSVEAVLSNDWLVGATVFDNSFDQPSQLVFAGKRWTIGGSEDWYLKLIGGLLHGYKEPYENKIPMNGLGVAPVLIPTLGFRYRSLVAEANLGGLAVVVFTVGVRF